MTTKLSPDRYARARRFLLERARPLEAATFLYRFEGGPEEAVYAELGAFQNPDGGFGRALEPDVRSSASSVLGTITALHKLRQLHAPPQHPLVAGALAYLLAAYDAAAESWPLVTPAIEDAPHAPWWNDDGLAARFNNFAINPRAEVLGYLYEFAAKTNTESRSETETVTETANGAETGAPALALRDRLTPLVVSDLLARSGGMDDNEFICCQRLAESPGLPEAVAVELQRWLLRMAEGTVATDPAAWDGYVLQPLQVAPDRSAPLGIPLSHLLPQNLDHAIASQGEDGAWSPPWSWFGQDDAAWPQAQADWSGILTLERLEWLHAYDRIAAAT